MSKVAPEGTVIVSPESPTARAVPVAGLGSGSASSSVFLSGASTWIAAGGGKINQVLQVVELGRQTTTSTSWVDITDMTLGITPSAADSKIMVMFNGSFGFLSNYTFFIRLVRLVSGGSDAYPYIGDTGLTTSNRATLGQYQSASVGNRAYMGRSFQYLDSPATTSAVTYRIQWYVEGNTVYLGRSGQDTDQLYHAAVPAALQLMEVLA